MALMEKILLTFGEHIRLLREKEKMSLREVAYEIGRNERQATKEHIKLFAKFFKHDEQFLIEENLSDQLAYKIIESDANVDILKVAEKKIEYLKTKR